MNKLLEKFLIVLLGFVVWNCEDIDVVEIEIDHETKLVVQCELFADTFFDGVYLTRTLPLSEQYNESDADIPDATLFLIVDSIKIIPLHYAGFGKYVSISEFRVRGDQVYELYGLIENEEIYAITKIPRPPLISEQRFVPEGYLSSVVKANPGEVYGAIWLMMNNVLTKPFDQSNDFYTITLNPETEFEDKLVRTTKLKTDYLSTFYKDKIYLQVFAFDKSYYNYFFTKDNNNPVDDTFSQGGGPIDWNVQGDNVIGMFIGVSRTGFVQIEP
ncbi:MAG: DUF4249 family protein [Melioribacteraceae bacterium]|nr:DUF4249 family protein [Melioribacteraceae bacterium]